MAIDQRGQVTTTGMMNKSGMNLQVPDMSNLVGWKTDFNNEW